MTEKLSWLEIKEQYPNQWVSLCDIEYDKNNEMIIKSAIVFAANEDVLAGWTQEGNVMMLMPKKTPSGFRLLYQRKPSSRDQIPRIFNAESVRHE